jgi:CheY-like chemotaxis protein
MLEIRKRSGGQVLAVDDDEISLRLICCMLDRLGISALAANDGETALAMLHDAAESVDLVLLNVGMPRMNGYKVCQAIRLDPLLAHVPVIFVTARGIPPVSAYAVGANDILQKPYSISDLRKKVTPYLQ